MAFVAEHAFLSGGRVNGVQRAGAWHEAQFGRASEACGVASGRVNLIGDHIDYAGGTVLPMALHECTVVALARATCDVFSSASTVDLLWTRYAAGVLTELRASGMAVPPVSVAVVSDLTIGAGLSSSAALEVAVARAALTLVNATMDADALALLCQRAEHRHAGTPCGIMDQWCVAHANPGEAILLDCARLDWRRLALPPTLRIELIDSGVRHALRDGGYASRRAEVEEAAQRLGVDQLAALPAARWSEIDQLPDRLARRARHVVRGCARVHEAVRALESNDLAQFGRLLTESHCSLRDEFDVSTPELDAIVAEACVHGALGARMTGGGFGGCVVVAHRA